jgi:hypothetical protein
VNKYSNNKGITMLRFAQYLNEQTAPVEQGVIDSHGVPNGVVLHQRITQGAKSKDGTPMGLIAKKRLKPMTEGRALDKWMDHNDNHHIGETHNQVHAHMVASDRSPGTDDTKHVKKYSDESAHLNKQLYRGALRGEKVDTTKHIAGHDVKGLDKALSRNKLGHDLHVHSGLGFNIGEHAAKHAEGHFHLPAYTSTSLSKHTAMEFAEPDENNESHILHLHLKKGQKGKYIAAHSHAPEEREFVVPRGTTVKVHPKPDEHYTDDGQKIHVWHAHVVDKKESE